MSTVLPAPTTPAAVPTSSFDWLPLALVPLLALLALPLVGSPATWVTLTVAGLGISLLPGDQSRPGLQRLFPMQPAFPAALWLLTHPDLRRVARIRAFSEFLSAKLRDEPRLK